jgi:hypothetical protein
MKFAHENLEARPVECRLQRSSIGGFHWIKKRAVDFAVLVIDVVEEIDSGRKHYRQVKKIEACLKQEDALRRERYLKTYNGKMFCIRGSNHI